METPEEPRWLTEEEQQTWIALAGLLIKVPAALDAQLQRDAGLSHADYEILVRLSEAPQRRMRMSELADRTLFSRSRLSHAVSRLEAAGLVRRESCAEDGRGTLARLTEVGYARLAEAAPGHVAAVRGCLFDPLTSDQVRQLHDICSRLRTTLSPLETPPVA